MNVDLNAPSTSVRVIVAEATFPGIELLDTGPTRYVVGSRPALMRLASSIDQAIALGRLG